MPLDASRKENAQDFLSWSFRQKACYHSIAPKVLCPAGLQFSQLKGARLMDNHTCCTFEWFNIPVFHQKLIVSCDSLSS